MAAAATLVAAAAAYWGWNEREARAEVRGPLRLGVAPIENQSGDQAIEWAGRFVSEALPRQLEGLPNFTAFSTASANEAAARGANRILSARIGRANGKPSVHWSVENARDHKTEAWGEIDAGPDWLSAARKLAGAVAGKYRPEARPSSLEVHNTRAAERWAHAMASRDAAAALIEFEAAVQADPACGWCWLSYGEAASRSGDPAKALAVLAAGREKGQGVSALPRARLDLMEAVLRGDDGRRLAALEAIGKALPQDAAVSAELGLLYTAQKHYDRAERSFQRALDRNPADGPVWNSYAYVLAYAGKSAEARKAVARYAQLDAGPNPADSQGEILHMAGEFLPAARAFHASFEKDRSFNQGAAAEKEALAYWLAGEKKKAGDAVDVYLGLDPEGRNALSGIARARWEMMFGRTKASEARLEAISRDERHPAAAVASALLALRAMWRDDAKAAREAAGRAVKQASHPAQKALAELAEAVVDPDAAGRIGTPRMRTEALALAATVRGDWPRAATAWKTAMAEAAGGNDQLHRELLAFCLVMSGREKEAEPLISGWWPLLEPEHFLVCDFLVYPYAHYTRGAVAAATGRATDAQKYFDQFAQFAGDRADRFGVIRRAREATRL